MVQIKPVLCGFWECLVVRLHLKKKIPPKMVPLPATSFSFGRSQDDTCIKGADEGSKPGHMLESEIILNVLLILSRKQVNLWWPHSRLMWIMLVHCFEFDKRCNLILEVEQRSKTSLKHHYHMGLQFLMYIHKLWSIKGVISSKDFVSVGPK